MCRVWRRRARRGRADAPLPRRLAGMLASLRGGAGEGVRGLFALRARPPADRRRLRRAAPGDTLAAVDGVGWRPSGPPASPTRTRPAPRPGERRDARHILPYQKGLRVAGPSRIPRRRDGARRAGRARARRACRAGARVGRVRVGGVGRPPRDRPTLGGYPKIASGKYEETIQFGASTTSEILRSTTRLASA